ncbi:ABC transporter substrate-binding protein [Brevibacterium sp. RIT 803]|uniref:ABC transporter substrate-binding protein n=1 Tax=Brevibacterium sp. RIT 803 TaxID=2810210 RepID=UPI00194E74AC|nr:ABC transporter substrate-binding protein [Brevibacterium sp. RIT 803]MBM6588888.1 ABC transporter substrate-binding protein [Brevibacterium sp. RIT 803]
MKKKKQLCTRVSGMVAALALILTGCGGGGDSIALGNVPALYWAAWSATNTALEDGEGDLDVEAVQFKSSADVFVAMRSDDVQVASMGMNVMVNGLVENPDTPMQMIAGVSPGRSQIIVRDQSEIGDWSDLKGKNLGVIRGSTDELIFKIALAHNDIDMDQDTTITTLQAPADLLLALRNGDIDAAVTYQPYTAQAVKDGVAEMPEDMNTEMTEWASVPTGIYASDDLIESDPESVQKIVDTFVAETRKFDDKNVWVDTALKYQAGDRDLLLTALEDDKPWFLMEEDKLGSMAKAMAEFGAVPDDVSGELRDRVNYDFLSKSTGMSPEELGKSEGN